MVFAGPSHILGGIGAFLVIYECFRIIYNVWFHPLRKFPGPFWMRASRIPYCHLLIKGTLPFDILDLHRQYGYIVRVAPDELAFSDHDAWKDIMGHRTSGNHQAEFPKHTQFYKPLGGPSDIVNSVGEEHSALRRLMSHGFSDRSLREQEALIKKYIDLLIERLHQNAAKPLDIMSWYNYTTFDVIGDLAFGEPFGCLNSSDYHPWVRNIFDMARLGSVFQVASYFPLVRRLLVTLLSSKSMRIRKAEHERLTREKLEKRIELGTQGGRSDLVENLIRKKDAIGLSTDSLLKNCNVLIVGGSETTATLLSGVTYLLLQNPETLRKLTEEVRSTFQSEDEINFTSVNNLSYMLACLNEALRVYPPIPGGLPRVTPPGGGHVSGHFIPENTIVAIHQWAMYHNERHFKDPFEYRPERFLGDERYKNDQKEAMQPFHTGPRNCLGRNLAYVEMRTILARVVWNFDMELADESKDWIERQKVHILWDKGPLVVRLRPVEHD